MDREAHFLEFSRYLALNPVRAGLAQRPEQWMWSSHRVLAGPEPAPRLFTTEAVWNAFDANDIPNAQAMYRRFVDAETPEDEGVELRELAEKGGLAGDKSFIHRFTPALRAASANGEIPRRERLVGRPTLETLFGAYGPAGDRAARTRFACSVRGDTGSEIASHLGVGRSTVSRAMRSARERSVEMTQWET